MSFTKVGISSGGARWCRKRQETVIVCYGKERVKRETGAACACVRVRVCARGDLVYKEVLVIVVSVIDTASSRTGALILVLVLVLPGGRLAGLRRSTMRELVIVVVLVVVVDDSCLQLVWVGAILA